MFLVAAVLGVFAWDQRSNAIDNERLAEQRALESRSRELAAGSPGQIDRDPELSLLLATQAMRSSRTPEALESLRLALSESNVRVTFQGHEADVVTASYSPDGERLLTASYDGTARIWDVDAGADTQPVVLAGHGDLLEAASFNRDGSLVVTSSFDGTAKVWDAATGEEVSTLEGHDGAVHDAEFVADGATVVTVGDDATGRIWQSLTGRQLRVLRGHTRPIYDVDVSDDGTGIVTASDDDTARVWDAASGRELLVLDGHDDGLYAAVFDPSGRRIVTASEDETAKVWDARSGDLVARLVGHRGPVVAASFSPGGKAVVTASEDGSARIWAASSGRQLFTLRGHQAENWASFSQDGRQVITASMDGTARVWDATDGASLAILRGHDGGVITATFSVDGAHVATGGKDGSLRIWEPVTGRTVFSGESSWTWMDPSGERITIASFDGTVHVVDVESGRELWNAHPGVPQTSANFSGDGTLVVSGAFDGVGRVWDADTGRLVSELRGHDETFLAADFYGTDRVLTWSDDGTARLWNPRTGDELMVFDHGSSIWEAHLGADGTRVLTTGITDGVIRMWDAGSGQELWTAEGLLTTGGIGAGFSPDGTLVGTVSTTATIWDVESGRKTATLDHSSKPLNIHFSPNGRTVVTRFEDGAARIWNPRTGKVVRSMAGHPGTVKSALFSADGRWVVTTADDGEVRVWEAATGSLITTYDGAGGPGGFAFLALGDRWVLSQSENGVRVDRCDVCRTTEELLDLARERITRRLTDAERAEYLGEGDASSVVITRREGLRDDQGRPVRDGPLEPGEYSAVGFDPGLSFSVDEGWISQTFLDKAQPPQVPLGALIQLQRIDRPSDGMGFVMLDPGRVIDGFKEWDERENILPFPGNFPAWLATHPDLEASNPRELTLGGVEGVSVDTVVTSVPEENPWPNCGGCVTVLAMSLTHQTGPITTDNLINALGPGERDRWIVLETVGNTLLVNAFSASEADFREFMPVVNRVLSTMKIGEQ